MSVKQFSEYELSRQAEMFSMPDGDVCSRLPTPVRVVTADMLAFAATLVRDRLSAPSSAPGETLLDFPTAWAICKQTRVQDHHERCSYRMAEGAVLCDCAAMDAARAALGVKLDALPTHAAPTCATCRHFTIYTEGYHRGDCGRGVKDDSGGGRTDPLGYGVAPTFGCTLHEPLPSPPPQEIEG